MISNRDAIGTILLLKFNLNKRYNALMTLDEIAFDVPARIVEFSSTDATEKGRLSGLGVRVGVVVTKLMPTPLRDPVACLVGPQLLALDRRLLRRIRVEAA